MVQIVSLSKMAAEAQDQDAAAAAPVEQSAGGSDGGEKAQGAVAQGPMAQGPVIVVGDPALEKASTKADLPPFMSVYEQNRGSLAPYEAEKRMLFDAVAQTLHGAVKPGIFNLSEEEVRGHFAFPGLACGKF